MALPSQRSLHIDALRRAYAETSFTPLELADEIHARLERTPHGGVFIGEPTHAALREAAQTLMARRARGETMPLYGIPFAVKDNIDVAGLETTAACPAFAYRAQQSAPVVEQLQKAGALLVGKTNLDQFATGLSGTRTPYGVAANPFDPRYIPGGSSSGSAVAVARGLCSFALGTDTAGSGRVPAAFNNLVGLKPTRGMFSARGVVPACRSLDCVSVFALTVDDACEVGQLLAGYDPADAYSLAEARSFDPRPGLLPPAFRFVQPKTEQLVLDDAEGHALFARACASLAALGGKAVQIDFAPFARAASLLYEDAWVGERLEAPGALLARDPEAVHPVPRAIFESAARYSSADAFRVQHELAQLRRTVDAVWDGAECLIVPTAPGIYTQEQLLAEPFKLVARLGTYANFVNLLDLCALAVPAGMRGDGLPFGVTLVARRGRDALLASLGRRLHAVLATTLGATQLPLPEPAELPARAGGADRVELAVVGAHLSGQPLNPQLTDLGARLVCAARTAPHYRLFALPTTPKKPGLVRDAAGAGHPIELEVWELSHEALGTFMRKVAAPLCIGSIELEDGRSVLGFLCEAAATLGQPEISAFGGWRKFLAAGG